MIPELPPRDASELIDSAPRAIAHLRAQLHRKRLGLIFGSGASKDLGFPDWKTLVGRIARHKHVGAEYLVRKFLAGAKKGGHPPVERRSLASITQMLFGAYGAKVIKQKRLLEPLSFLVEQDIRTSWMKIIHAALYQDVPVRTREEQICKHKYIPAFLEIIKQSPMTVNYNFDDTLERLLMFHRDEQEKVTTRGYETTYKPNSQFKNDYGLQAQILHQLKSKNSLQTSIKCMAVSTRQLCPREVVRSLKLQGS